MADEVDSKSIGGNTVRVQVPQPALLKRIENLDARVSMRLFFCCFFYGPYPHRIRIRKRSSRRTWLLRDDDAMKLPFDAPSVMVHYSYHGEARKPARSLITQRKENNA